MKQKLMIIGLAAFSLFSTSCKHTTNPSDNSTQEPPAPTVDLDKEASLVPWEKISGKIAYTRSEDQNGTTYKLLLVMDGSTRKIQLLTYANGPYHEFDNLAWSPDGSAIAYSFRNIVEGIGKWELHKITTENGSDSYVLNGAYPAWSRLGKFSYFWSESQDLIDVAGNIIIDSKFTIFPAGQSRVTWSLGDSLVVFIRADSTCQAALYKIQWQDTLQRGFVPNTLSSPLLQSSGEYNNRTFDYPAFSPDGKTIAFVDWGLRVWNHAEIWLINMDGTNPQRLTTGHNDLSPVWSPDGRHIAFDRSDTFLSQLFIMNSDGTDTTQITLKGGQYAAWMP